MNTSKLVRADKLEYIKRCFGNLYKFIGEIEDHDWVLSAEFINQLELDDFRKLDEFNKLLGGKLYQPILVLMQSEMIGMSLSELLAAVQDKHFSKFFLRYHIKYPRIIALWLEFYRHPAYATDQFVNRRRFFVQMISDADHELACKFFNLILGDPAMFQMLLDDDAKVFDTIYAIYCKDRALYRRMLDLPFCKDEKNRNKTLVKLEKLEQVDPKINSQQFDRVLERAVKFTAGKQHFDPEQANEHQKKEQKQNYIAELEDFISAMTYIQISKHLPAKVSKEIQLEKKANKNNAKVTAAQKLLNQLRGEKVGFTNEEMEALMTGKLLEIQTENLSELDLLKRYVAIRRSQPDKFFSHTIYTEERKVAAAEKRIKELEGDVVKYSFFEKRALKQGRLGEIEKRYTHPKK